MRTVLVSTLLWLMPASIWAEEAKWQPYSFAGHRFSANFPGEPKVVSKMLPLMDTGLEIDSMTLNYPMQNCSLSGASALFPVSDKIDGTADVMLQQIESGLQASGEVRSVNNIEEYGAEGFLATVASTNQNGTPILYKQKILYKDNLLLQVVAEGYLANESTWSLDADQFLSGVRFTDQ